tara:strand:- start:11160 stop:12473 length:1314 start_codon:yes stop_codon:yes gene_type:complete
MFSQESVVKTRLYSLIWGTASIRFIGLLLGFLIGVQLARYLGVENYGVYSTVMSIISILMIPTEMGLPRLLTREVARDLTADKNEAIAIFRWAFFQVIFASIITIMLLAAYGMLNSDSKITVPLLWASLLIPLTALLNIYCAALRGMHLVAVSQIFDTLIRYIIFSLLLFMFFNLYESVGINEALLLSSISILLPLMFSHIYLRKVFVGQIFKNSNRISFDKARIYWSSLIPMALTEGMVVIRSNLQILTLSIMASLSDVGVFKIAASTMLILSMPITIVNLSLAPVIARLYAENKKDELSELLEKVSVFLVISTLSGFIPFIFYGEEIFGFVFGIEYEMANDMFFILGLGMVLSSVFGACSITLNMTGHEKYVLKSGVYSLILLITLSLPCIYYLQGEGAAIASTVAVIYWSFLMWTFCKKTVGLDTSLLSYLGVK